MADRNTASPSSSSSRRSKNKPKQPQRGLGVAQLEKLRLHEEMERYCYNPNPNPNSNPNPIPIHVQSTFIPSNFTQGMIVHQGPYSPSTTPSLISYGFQQNITMDQTGLENANTCWRPSGMNMLESVQYGHTNMDRQFIDLNEQDCQGIRRNNNISNSREDQEQVDLELRL